MKHRFKSARENLEDVDRGDIYPNHLQGAFLGMPRDFFAAMGALRRDVRYRDFAERKEMEFPILVSQKFGFMPKWFRNYQKEVGKSFKPLKEGI